MYLDVKLPLHLRAEDGRARRALVQLALVAVLDREVHLQDKDEKSGIMNQRQKNMRNQITTITTNSTILVGSGRSRSENQVGPRGAQNLIFMT